MSKKVKTISLNAKNEIAKSKIQTAPEAENLRKQEVNIAAGFEPIEFPKLDGKFDRIIRLKQYDLKNFLYAYLLNAGYKTIISKDGYLYAKGNTPIMLLAHMDTVHKHPVSTISITENNEITSPEGIGGDDRCGVYAIIRCVDAMKSEIKPHILFTEDEEIGCIGAGKYCKDIQNREIEIPNVNFLVQIDRKNDIDSVYYDLDNPEFEKYINGFGFKTAYGSCSDISYVAPALDVAAVNLSSGYYNPHMLEEYISIDELENTISKVVEIIIDNHKKNIKYEYKEREFTEFYDYPYENWYDYEIAGSRGATDKMLDEGLWDYHNVELLNENPDVVIFNAEEGKVYDSIAYSDNYYVDEDGIVYYEEDIDGESQMPILYPTSYEAFTSLDYKRYFATKYEKFICAIVIED